MNACDSDVAWYVLRVTYQRELAAKRALGELGIEHFVPVRTVRRRNAAGRFYRAQEAALHNYVFARTTRAAIDELKTFRLPYLRYVVYPEEGRNRIMTVPEEQMNHFIAVAGRCDEQVLFLRPEEVDLAQGDRVRITGGVFAGVEGVFVRVRNARQRRVVVRIDGVAAVATAAVPAQLIEKI